MKKDGAERTVLRQCVKEIRYVTVMVRANVIIVVVDTAIVNTGLQERRVVLRLQNVIRSVPSMQFVFRRHATVMKDMEARHVLRSYARAIAVGMELVMSRQAVVLANRIGLVRIVA